MLTPEELQPDADDIALGDRLVAEGWVQTSAKYRHLLRWAAPPPTFEEIVRPEHLATYFGQRVRERLHDITGEWAMRMAPKELVEELTLTVREFAAFKSARRRARATNAGRRRPGAS